MRVFFLITGLLYAQQPLPNLGRAPRAGAPPAGFVDVEAVTQEVDGAWRRLRGRARIETAEMLLTADEIDYHRADEYAEARGNVHYKSFERNEELWAAKVEYYLDQERGKFYEVRGNATTRIDARPGLPTTQEPFYFEARWAERLGSKYILHDGLITNCRLPRPWWTLRGPRFDIIPNDRAIAHRAVFRVRKMPLFYTPYFYKSLEREPRRSGLLAPNIGNSSRRGKMFGVGYYWAINRSYDAAYRLQNFTQRGFAHHVDVRGKPRPGTDFNLIYYGVDDRGLKLESGERRKEGGYSWYGSLQSDLGRGFHARGTLNYLSSLVFRQAFTESFQEAVFSEVHSVGYVGKQWSTYSFNVGIVRLENFQSTQPGDTILIRKLPEITFSSRDRQLWKNVPVWVSFESAAALLRRTQPLFQTRQFLERFDAQPRVTTALRWKDFHLLPSFSVRQTHWGSRQDPERITGEHVRRNAREFSADLIAPSLARTFRKKSFLGDELRHVIEPRASFRHVAGVADFDRFIRFDETELLTNTTEAEVSLTNRIFAKRKGVVSEVLSWQVWQRRYFDPDFGGAVVAGRRNVVVSSVELTPYTFLDRARHYSPIISVLRMIPRPGIGIDWRTDYDPLRTRIVNSSISADGRVGHYFVSLGHSHVRSSPILTPSANQFRGVIGIGQPGQRGWNTAFTAIYDFRLSTMQFATTEVAYNTDCCGISLQYRRFGFGTRNENQFRIAFAVANLGTFGTLKKQERLF
ncbi:MAG: LPS-assembly protein LptD [Bryobacteraceae bacterium]